MCGIAGIKLFNNSASKTEEEQLNIALRLQKHRGPDASKVLLHHRVALGHNRLSIIDTNERSHQPFLDDSGRYSLIFNGEIYNYHELKNDLLQKGYAFKTSSDTEVLFYHLMEHRADGLKTLRGCFAFAFYDREDDYLLLARDRMGINPLLYAFEEDRLVFGSELEVFKPMGVGQSISLQALNYYFQYTYIPAPFTIYEEVQKLAPGHFIELKGSNFKVEAYWDPRADHKFEGSFEDAKIQLRERVEFAVVSQLEADVPIGTFLSGGVDSSIVSAIASQSKDDLHTFSVSFGDQQAYDESQYALKVAKHIRSQHHVIRLKEQDFRLNFTAILDSFDEPFADSSAIAMWFLAQETSRHLTVALSGDGADELLAGYNKHVAFKKAVHFSNLKKAVMDFGKNLTHPVLRKFKPNQAHKISKFNDLLKLSWPQNYWYLASNIGEKSKNKLLKNSFPAPNLFHLEYRDLNDFLYLDQVFVLPNDMLKKVDLMSMQHSLEVRTPFMDKDLVKFVNSLPADWKLHGYQGKHILKETFKGLLPDEIFTRKKQGFEVPLNAWIKSNWNELIPTNWFDAAYIAGQNIFKYDAVLELKRQFFSNIGTSNQEMWAYIVFQHWYQKSFGNA